MQSQQTESQYRVKISGDPSIDYVCSAQAGQAAAQLALNWYREAHPKCEVRSCSVFEGSSDQPVLTLAWPPES